MPIIAIHLGSTVELALTIFWLTSAILYYRAMFGPGQRVLKPIRFYAMCVSLAWGGWYLILFSDVFNEQEWWRQQIVHGIGDGLMVATVAYFLIVSITSVRLLSKLGVD